MSDRGEPGLSQPPRERPELEPGQLRELKGRDLGIRFAFGAATSAVAAGLTLAFGPRVGGVMLAFPAILAASLTLIADDEGSAQAREDSRGAILGGVALAAFAAVCVWLFGRLPGGVVLLVAAVVWAVVALGLYFLLWGPQRRG